MQVKSHNKTLPAALGCQARKRQTRQQPLSWRKITCATQLKKLSSVEWSFQGGHGVPMSLPIGNQGLRSSATFCLCCARRLLILGLAEEKLNACSTK